MCMAYYCAVYEEVKLLGMERGLCIPQATINDCEHVQTSERSASLFHPYNLFCAKQKTSQLQGCRNVLLSQLLKPHSMHKYRKQARQMLINAATLKYPGNRKWPDLHGQLDYPANTRHCLLMGIVCTACTCNSQWEGREASQERRQAPHKRRRSRVIISQLDTCLQLLLCPVPSMVKYLVSICFIDVSLLHTWDQFVEQYTCCHKISFQECRWSGS